MLYRAQASVAHTCQLLIQFALGRLNEKRTKNLRGLSVERLV
jgi:hypothetical protein